MRRRRAELVALGVGQHSPAIEALHFGRAERLDPVDLAHQVISEQVQVQPAPALPAFGHGLRGQAHAALVRVLQTGGALIRGSDLVPSDRLPGRCRCCRC